MKLLVPLLALVVTPTVAEAGKWPKKERKAFEAEVEAAYPDRVWALKDMPARTGLTMMAAWLAPILEVYPDRVEGDVDTPMSSNMVSGVQSVWWGVRPYDTLELKEVNAEKEYVELTFVGVGDSDSRDTKVKLVGSRTFSDFEQQLGQLVATSDPVKAEWPEDIRAAIRSRTVINGMTKRQAYLVVGEPTGAVVDEADGQKVETWTTRQDSGARIGYGAKVERTGYPPTLRFVDGVLTGVSTSPSGGVSLD